MKVYFGCSLPCLDFAGVSFTKWEPVEDIDFLSALVEPDSLGVFFFLFFFTLNSCDIRTSLFGFGVIKAQPAAECVFLLKLSREHIPVCVHIVQYTVKRGGVQFALFYRK